MTPQTGKMVLGSSLAASRATLSPEGDVRVLVVDDDRLLNRMICDALRKEGFETRAAFDGHTAIRLQRSFQPHVVILDVVLPGENGYRISRAIKTLAARPDGGLAPKILLATARFLGDEPERERVMLEFAKADAMLYKPVPPAHLVDTIRAVTD